MQPLDNLDTVKEQFGKIPEFMKQELVKFSNALCMVLSANKLSTWSFNFSGKDPETGKIRTYTIGIKENT
jgi:hypothetical protein